MYANSVDMPDAPPEIIYTELVYMISNLIYMTLGGASVMSTELVYMIVEGESKC